MRNFGHDGPAKFNGVGINGKNSEFHAAMGLCVLSSLDSIMAKRKQQTLYYDEELSDLPLRKQKIQEGSVFNHAYYPIIFEDEEQLTVVSEALINDDIHPRRYFYPSLSKLEYVEPVHTPVSDAVASSILCLPMYHTLKQQDQERISKIIRRQLT